MSWTPKQRRAALAATPAPAALPIEYKGGTLTMAQRDGLNIKEVAAVLRWEWVHMRRTCNPNEISDGDDVSTAGMDVRLRLTPDGDWELLPGSADYDQDHRGYWGVGWLPYGRTNCRQLARELIEEVREAVAQDA